MINEVVLDGNKYEYVSGSWTRSVPIKTTRTQTQNRPVFQYDGLDAGTQTITLLMQTWRATWGVSTNGASQLAQLETSFSKTGVSMPILWVDVNGSTYSVVPFGTLEITQLQRYGSTATPTEYQVSITLNEV